MFRPAQRRVCKLQHIVDLVTYWDQTNSRASVCPYLQVQRKFDHETDV